MLNIVSINAQHQQSQQLTFIISLIRPMLEYVGIINHASLV